MTAVPVAVDTVVVADPALLRRLEQLELSLLEREALIEALQARLDHTQEEVVRVMARQQQLATRAEAASGLAEAEVTVRSLRVPGGPDVPPEAAEARRLLNLGNAEFQRENYGTASYLATQAKTLARAATARRAGGEWGRQRADEVVFLVPLRLETRARATVRQGPGDASTALFTLEPGTPVHGYSYADRWVHVRDEAGRSGWLSYGLLGKRPEARP